MIHELQTGDLLTEREVSAILKISRRTLANWRWSNTGLRAVKIGTRAIRYRRSDLEKFINGYERGAA